MDKFLDLFLFFRQYVVPASVLLGILIFVHEFGHFIIAKITGVKVLKFSLGFGPKIIGKKVGDTEYLLSVLPLGGYVKPLGESPDEPIADQDKPLALSHQRVLKRFVIIAAGSLFNIIFAWLLFSAIYMLGTPMLTPKVGKVIADSPAERAGIKEGDTIISVDGKQIELWDELSHSIERSKGRKIQLQVERDGKIIILSIAPRITVIKDIFQQERESYKIGIIASESQDAIIKKRYNPAVAVWKGLTQTWTIAKLTLVSIIKLIQRVIPADQLGGPIRIAEIAGKFAAGGLLSFLSLMAMISINLGILNLLPIPILDGGHIFFLMIEAVRGRPVSMRKMEIAQQIGLAILIIIMAFVFYNDITRLIPR